MASTRRLAAILAADVAGYSRLMGADEEGTHERLKAHFRELVDPKIAEHRGRIVKNTGDGFLAEFPSVVDAVRCAVEVQRGMADREPEVTEERRIRFRFGVNLGDVIVEGHDIFGDGVNVAARLEALAEPGGICVSRVVRDQIRDKLPYPLEDMGEQRVKNIARPVRVYRVGIGPPVTVLSAKAPDAAVEASLPLPDKPSVAVLPFANMSSDPEQEFLADGIAEDIITALSRYPSLFVIARSSSFTYKGQAIDVKTVGRELGVRYVLEGSLRKAGDRIRVTAQLVEAETGKHVWANRYDRALADIFAVQDEITEAVTIAIAPAIADAEQHRALRKPVGSLDAWTAYQRGLWHYSKTTADDNAAAQRYFQQAIDLDPTFAGAHWGLAIALGAADRLWGNLRETPSSAETLMRRALALDAGDALTHWRRSMLYRLRGNLESALAEANRAVEITPNLAPAHLALAMALIFSGQPKEGLTSIQRCLRLDPRGPGVAGYLLMMTIAHYLCHDYDAAVEVARRTVLLYPDYPNIYRWLAAALGQLGRTDEARGALEKAIAISPASFDMYVRKHVPWHRPEDHAHMLEGLRKAGVPEE
jgi:adenylate cyclase